MKKLFQYPFFWLWLCSGGLPCTQAATHEHAKTDSLVFMCFRAEATSATTTPVVTLLRTWVKPGKLKKNATVSARTPRSLACVLQNSKGTPDTLWVENPLQKYWEYADDHHTLHRKENSATKGDFFIRFRQADYKSVTVFQPSGNGKWISLLQVAL